MHENSVVSFGRARFTFYTDRLVRLEWSAEGRFEDRPTLRALRPEPPSLPLKVERGEDAISIDSGPVRLRYRESDEGFAPDTLDVTFETGGERIRWHYGKPAKNDFLGLATSLDKCNGERPSVFLNADAEIKSVRETGEPLRVDSGVVSSEGWALIDDSDGPPLEPHPTLGEWFGQPLPGPRTDAFLFAYGKDYRGAVAAASRVFGTQPLLPRYAFGYWYSRFWAYTETELLELADTFDAFRMPLDVLVVDMDWHRPGWTGFSWDADLFPAPSTLLESLRRRHLRITLNLHPAGGVDSREDAYEAVAKRTGTASKADGVVPFEPTNPDFMSAYFEELLHPLEDQGVDFWWMDWQQWEATEIPGLTPLRWLAHTHWNDQLRRRKDRRPLNFTRYSGIGSGRMPMTFMGDTFSSWQSLAAEPGYIARGANVLHGYLSTDIGGHLPLDTSPELYLRWMQFAVHSPLTRTHASKDDSTERRFWQFPEPYGPLLRRALSRRYELIPYIYTEAAKMEATGLSLHRPLFYDFPESPEAARQTSIYSFGDAMLVSPVVAPADESSGLAQTAFWLPPGEWIDCALGLRREGNRSFKVPYLLGETPVFVRPGSILPGQKDVLRCGGGSAPNLLLEIWPGGNGDYTLYEDDGISRNHLRGAHVEVGLEHREESNRATVRITPARRNFPGFLERRPLRLSFRCHFPPRAVGKNGRPLAAGKQATEASWHYDGFRATVEVDAGIVDLREETLIELEYESSPEILDGTAGRLARLAEAGALSREASLWKPVHPDERLPARVELTGRRATLRPDQAAVEYELLRERGNASREALKTTLESYMQRLAASPGSRFEAHVRKIKKAIHLTDAALSLGENVG